MDILGEGVDAINKELLLSEVEKISIGNIVEISLDAIKYGIFQPRKSNIHDASLQELSNSIKQQGVLLPVLVRDAGKGKYQLIAGERRCRASELAGLTHVPALVKDVSNQEAFALAIIENLQRQDLNPIDEAEALQRLIDEFGMTHEEVSKSVGKSRTSVSNSLRLLNLSPFVKECLAGNKIQAGHAKPMITMDFAQQDKFCSEIIANQFSVRETEKRSKNTKPVVKKTTLVHPDFEKWRKTMSHILEMKVDFDVNELGAGKITIHVKDSFQIEQLIDSMS